jgi:hypothetical protein
MNDEQIALAKRAVACKVWRWMPGMLTVENFRCIWSDAWQIELASYAAYNHRRSHLKSELPNLTDPATLGCLLALVREAFHSTNVFVLWSADRKTWIVKHGRALVEAQTEAEALVAALEAAP